jgi:hypothetical protein
MGLDNIPNTYPCERLGTAVMVDIRDREGNPVINEATGLNEKRVDCDETIAQGKCPHKLALEKSGITDASVLGMFGTYCWYRGKYGNYLLSQLGEDAFDFYGDNEDGTYKSPSSCLITAEVMEDAFHEQVNNNGTFYEAGTDEPYDIAPQIRYAIWWLRWVANECNGARCWY